MENQYKESLKMEDKYIVDLTQMGLFSGLYETIWADDSEEQENNGQYYSDMLLIPKDSIYVGINRNYYLEEIAKLYENILENELGGEFKFHHSFSPSEYNFDTDHIYLTWVKEDKTTRELEEEFNDYVDSISDLNEYEQLFVYYYNDEGDNIKNECSTYQAFLNGVCYDIKSDWDNVWLEKDGIKC